MYFHDGLEVVGIVELCLSAANRHHHVLIVIAKLCAVDEAIGGLG